MAKSSTSFKPGHKGRGDRPPGSHTTTEIRDRARHLIEDPEYLYSLRRRLVEGKAPQMEMLLFKYAYEQPVERHEVNAEVRAASQTGARPMGAPAWDYTDRTAHLDSKGNIIMHGGIITKEGAETIRKLMAMVAPRIDAVRRADEGKLPPSDVPPTDVPA